MACILSPIPKFLFAILEPISLVSGAVVTLIAPNFFVVALQLGNMYNLVFMLGAAVFWTSTEPKVIRNYIFALWLADFGHIGATIWGMGLDKALDVKNWNALTWGNVGVTAVLCACRTAWMLGAFGPDKHGPLRRGLPNQRKNN